MNAEKNIVTIKKAIKALNERDMNAVKDLMKKDYVRHDLTSSFGERRGQGDTADFFQSVIRGIPDMQMNIKDIFATENRVALRYTLTGTHQGEYKGIPATGKKLEINAIHLYRFEGDKVAEQWALPDVAGIYRQMGVLNLSVSQTRSNS
jgi:steroid delta-isomerase-like uncharacterized protein